MIIGLLVAFSIGYRVHKSSGVSGSNPFKFLAVSNVEALESDLKPITPLTPLQPKYAVKWGSCGTKGYLGGQCVYGVAKWICVPPNLGNANRWDENARRLGYKVSSVPAVGTVAQSDAGYYGHVALVLKVQGNQVYTRGMNEAGPWSIRERWSPVSAFEYIYF